MADSSRINIRINSKAKRLIDQAAAVTGQTVSSFAVSVLSREARIVLAQQGSITLNADATRLFIERLGGDVMPNVNLGRAAERHQELLS